MVTTGPSRRGDAGRNASAGGTERPRERPSGRGGRRRAVAAVLAVAALAGCYPEARDDARAVATGPGAAEINCANDIRLQRAQARIYRVERFEAERAAVFARGSAARMFVCFTDRQGAVVHVSRRRGDRG